MEGERDEHNKEPGRLFIVPPFSSPESSLETGAVAFSGGCNTIALACMLSSISNRSIISCKLRVQGILRLVK